MSNKILDRDNPILRKHSDLVPVDTIKSAKIQQVLERMKEALQNEEDGVAIAAPQIGENLRIFIVSGRTFSILKNDMSNKESPDEVGFEDLVFINPEIMKISKRKKYVEEGCLSVRWLYGKVERSEKVLLRAYNERGEFFERGSSGLLAQIFQHEIDHLDGVLFIDKAKNLEEIPPKKEDDK